MSRGLLRRRTKSLHTLAEERHSTTMIWILCVGYLFVAVMAQTEVGVDMQATTTFGTYPEIYIGSSITVVFTVVVPTGATTTDTTTELIVPQEGVFTIVEDSVACSAGSSLSFDNPDYCSPTDTEWTTYLVDGYSDTDSIRYISHIVLNTGAIASTGGAEADNTFTVTFEAVCIAVSSPVVDSTYSISSGFAFDGLYIWVAQCDFTYKGLATDPTDSPTFSLEWDPNTATTIMDKGEQLKGKLTFGLPNIQPADLKLEFVSLNDTNCGLVIEKVQMLSVGSAYLYQLQPELFKADAIDQCCPTSLMVEIGTLVNRESQNPAASATDNDIEFEVTVMAANSSIPAGEALIVGVALYVGMTEIWVATLEIEKADETPGPIAISSDFIAGDNLLPQGLPGGIALKLTVAAGHHTIAISVSTEVESASENRLSILSVNVISTGSNIPCNPADENMGIVLTQSVPDSGVNDGATLEIGVFNHGLQDSPPTNADDVNLIFYYMITPGGSEGDQYKTTITIEGTPTEHVFSAAAAATPQQSVTNTFDIQHKCGVKPFETGSVIDYNLVVATERDSWAGETLIEGSIPADLNFTVFNYVSSTVTRVGANVASVPQGPMNTAFSKWPGSADIEDRGVTTITSVANVESIDDLIEDEYEMQLRFELKDDVSLLAGDPTVKAAIGVKYSPTQIFIAECDVSIRSPVDLGGVKYIEGLTVDADDECADDIKLQWSSDNLNFNDFNYSWKNYIVIPGQATTMELDTPLFARYIRLVNTNGGCSCAYTPISSDVTWEFKGDSTKTPVFQGQMMFAFDKDNATCIALPTKTSVDTPTYFFLNIPAALPYMDVDGVNPFKVHVTGQGIECNTPGGPSVVKVSNPHPKQPTALKFNGMRKKCAYLDKTIHTDSLTDLVTCHYHCDCSSADTCKDINLLVVHHGTPSADYSLCDITAEQIV